jgi:hypothetical protein
MEKARGDMKKLEVGAESLEEEMEGDKDMEEEDGSMIEQASTGKK